MRRYLFSVLISIVGAASLNARNTGVINSGNLNLSTGAVYGEMGMEKVKAMAMDENNLFVLVRKISEYKTYMLKYRLSDGVLISSQTIDIGPTEFEKILINGDQLVLVGENLATSKIVISAMSKNLQDKTLWSINPPSSQTGPKILIKDAFMDGNYLYTCNISTSYPFASAIVKFDLMNNMQIVAFYDFADNGFYVGCGRYMFKKNNTLYVPVVMSVGYNFATLRISTFSLDFTERGMSNELALYYTPTGNSLVGYDGNSLDFFVAVSSIAGPVEVRRYDLDSFQLNHLLPLNILGMPKDISVIPSAVLVGIERQNEAYKTSYDVVSLDTHTLNVLNTMSITSSEDNNYLSTIVSTYSTEKSTAYIAGEVYSYNIRNGVWDTDIRIVKFSTISVSGGLQINIPPVLSFSTEAPNGLMGGVHILALNQGATFYVVYRDLNNDTSSYVKIRIKGPEESVFSEYEMTYQENLSASPSQGMVFTYYKVFTTSGIYQYQFIAKDINEADATGLPVESIQTVRVLKDFEGSLSAEGVKFQIPAAEEGELREFKLFAKGDDVYSILNANIFTRQDSPSLLIKLAKTSQDQTSYYDFNWNWPSMNNPKRWTIYGADFNDAGNIEVVAASQTATNQYKIFLATINPNDFSLIGNTLDITQLWFLPPRLGFKRIGGVKYIWGGNNFAKCENFCQFYEATTELSAFSINSVLPDSGNTLYIAGEYEKGGLQNGVIFKFDLSQNKIVSTFTFSGFGSPTTAEGSFNEMILKDDYLFALGNFSTAVDNYGVVLKIDKSNLDLVDMKVLNPGKKEEFIKFIDLGNEFLVAGNFMDEQNRTIPFMMKLDATTLNFVGVYEDASRALVQSFGAKDIILSNNNLYYVKTSQSEEGLMDIEYKKVDQPSENKITLTLNLKDNNNDPLADVDVLFIPVEKEKVDLSRTIVGLKTGSDGKVSTKLEKDVSYFIAISTPDYSPSPRQQFLDPYRRFIRSFSADTSLQFTLTKKTQSKYSVVISSVAKGLELYGIIKNVVNNEPVSLAFSKATDSVITMDFFDIPQIEPNKYKLEITLPEILAFSTLIPSSLTLFVDFSGATPPSGSYEEARETTPLFRGVVLDSLTTLPVSNAKIFVSTNTNDWMCSAPVFVTNSDITGKFSVYYNPPQGTSSIRLCIKKEKYVPYLTNLSLPSDLHEHPFYISPATYSISGYIVNNGIPVKGVRLRAGSYNSAEYEFSGDDSYVNGQMSWVEGSATTDENGYFYIDGLTHGNVALRVSLAKEFERTINKGRNLSENYDDMRIVISSGGAIPPSNPPGNPCIPGKVWILSKNGECLGVAPYVFDITPELNVNATLYLTVSYDEVASDYDEGLIIVDEHSSNPNRTTITIPLRAENNEYVIGVSMGKRYGLGIISNKWAIKNPIDELDFTSQDTINVSIVLTRAGGLRMKILKPDGSIFVPVCNVEGCHWPRVYITSNDRKIWIVRDYFVREGDLDPIFEIPNLPPNRYSINLVAEGYPVTTLENVEITAQKTTELTLRMKEGVYVKPSISLPQLAFDSFVLALPAGFELKRKNINNLLFDDSVGEKYLVKYDTTTESFHKKILSPGNYDFYLISGSRYDPENDEGEPSFRSFVNFIGYEKNKTIQRDADIGTEEKPISDFRIYGSVGPAVLRGSIKGKKLITTKDGELLFSDRKYLISLIPSIMLYDESGNLRGYSHSLMDSSTTLTNFFEAYNNRDINGVLNVINSSATYYIPNLPPGRYTAVFTSPNYPAVSKEIIINSTDTVFDFDFDKETIIASTITIKVLDKDKNPISGARIYLTHKMSEQVGTTDKNGEYTFANIPLGLYKVEISKEGYGVVGDKFELSQDVLNKSYTLTQTNKVIKGRVYLSKFPQTVVKDGIEVVGYNESKLTSGVSYVPAIKTLTFEDGRYELKGVEPGTYTIVATYPGKLTQTVSVYIAEDKDEVYAQDMVFIDIPPQIDVKVRRYKKELELFIKTPKEVINPPKVKYLAGRYDLTTFDEGYATQLSLVKLPDRSYQGRFNISLLQEYYTIKVEAGDVEKISKIVLYDVKNDIASENYVYDKIYLGGSVYADVEGDDRTGIEFDYGAFTHSTTTLKSQIYGKYIKLQGVGDEDLIGGFFTALPTVRTIRTPKGELRLSKAIEEIMVSDVYNIELSNLQPNRNFTLTLRYDKEKVVANEQNLRIYQYNDQTGQWKEIQGHYTIDPMLGTVSVEVPSIEKAAEASGSDSLNPFIRKKLGMSAISNGRFVPQATTSSQTGRFAVFSAKPLTGVEYSGTSFEIYNIPNPFDLKSKTIEISADGGSWHGGQPYTTEGTIIKYHLPAGKSGHVKLVIYNIAGEKVRTLDEGIRTGGQIYYSEWDGRNDKNEKVASGVYFLVAYINGEKIGKTHKMAVIK